MTATIQRRVEALEVATGDAQHVGLVITLEGETNEQALARLGLADDNSRRWIVVVPMKSSGSEVRP